jgi:hypothetical protein
LIRKTTEPSVAHCSNRCGNRRRVFDYNPKGSRPPAQRWIDLHTATRARFLRDVSEIGVAQKVIRLRALDRFAEMAEDDNRHDKAAKYLEQAARDCGGFYENANARRRARLRSERSHALKDPHPVLLPTGEGTLLR